MNINDLSDGAVSFDHQESVPASKGKKKRAVIICILVLLIVAAVIGGSYIYRYYLYNTYGKPFISSNKKLEFRNEDEYSKMYSYDDIDDKISYTTTVGKFPDFKYCIVQAQALQGIIISPSGDPVSDHTLNCIYRLKTGEAPIYQVSLNEIVPANNGEDNYDIGINGIINLSPELNYQSSHITSSDGSLLSDSQQLELYTKYKDEINELWIKLFAFFGEEHFKK